MLDYSISKNLKNGVFDPATDSGNEFTPWCYAPEAVLGYKYSFNADVFDIAC